LLSPLSHDRHYAFDKIFSQIVLLRLRPKLLRVSSYTAIPGRPAAFWGVGGDSLQEARICKKKRNRKIKLKLIKGRNLYTYTTNFAHITDSSNVYGTR